MNGNHRAQPWHGLPRDEIGWWPIVQSCMCDGCGLCVTSCPVNAIAFDFELRIPFIKDLHQCVIGCSTCATLCPNEAILLPGREAVQSIISKRGLAGRARRELRLHRKRLAGMLPQAMNPGDVNERLN